MTSISTYSMTLKQLQAIKSTSALVQKYSTEASTGKKSDDLSQVPERGQILDLSVLRSRKEAYQQTCTTAETQTAQYTTVLSDLEDQLNTAIKAVNSVIGNTTGSATSSDSTVAEAYSGLSDIIDQVMTSVTADLNEKSNTGEGYLFGGLRSPTSSPSPTYSTPPVTNLADLPYFLGSNSPTPDPAGTTISGYTPPSNAVDNITDSTSGLPVYDRDYTTYNAASSTDQASLASLAYGTRKVTIDDGESVNVGISADNEAFQNLINGLRAAKTAADQAGTYTTEDRDAFMTLAQSCLSKALSGVRTLDTRNDLATSTISSKDTQLTTAINVIDTRSDALQAADTTVAATMLTASQNQLEASYKATSSIIKMSLLNYL